MEKVVDSSYDIKTQNVSSTLFRYNDFIFLTFSCYILKVGNITTSTSDMDNYLLEVVKFTILLRIFNYSCNIECLFILLTFRTRFFIILSAA